MDEALRLILAAAGVFSLHLLAISLLTLRVVFTTKGLEVQAAVAGFFEALAYVLAIGIVLQGLGNVLNLVAYGLGFSAGTVVGMRVEQRLAFGHVTIHVFTPPSGDRIANAIRSAGYGATVQEGRGREGPVEVVISIVPRKAAVKVTEVIRSIDRDAFISTDDARGVIRGWLGLPRRG